MPLFSSDVALPVSAGSRHRAKERLYVACQVGGWSFLLASQIFFAVTLSTPRPPPDEIIQGASIAAMVIALALLITHVTRPLIHRWGWKDLGWRALAPRILALAAVQSALLSVVGYGYPYGILRLPWPSGQPFSSYVAISWVNDALLFIAWYCVYFFYHLFDRYNRLEIERLRLATEVKEAELRALKSQVNPHFIFNALNSLRALIDEDPARARLAVTQLANLLRYSLHSTQAETVPFEDELRVVKDYLALEQVRHEERLRLRWEVAPETLRVAVPPLVLQTLVENAVKYGITPRPEGGEIAISARCVDGMLLLRVTNPGELKVDPNIGGGGSTGLGLRNAAERLRLSFGGRARLDVRPEGTSLVVAEVHVPAQVVKA